MSNDHTTTSLPKDHAGSPASPAQAELVKLALEQAQKILRKVPLLGPVAWLMMSSPTHKYTPVADFEWRVLPPVALDQAKVYMRNDAPFAFASWAFLGEETARRYQETGRLLPPDWNSGGQAWLIDLVTPYGGADELLKDLQTNTALKGHRVRMLMPEVGSKLRDFIEF